MCVCVCVCLSVVPQKIFHITSKELQLMFIKGYLMIQNLPIFLIFIWFFPSFESSHVYLGVQFSSVAWSCPTPCDPMNHSTPGLPVHHQLPEFTQTHIHRVSDAIQPSHPLSSPSPPAPNPSQHQYTYLIDSFLVLFNWSLAYMTLLVINHWLILIKTVRQNLRKLIKVYRVSIYKSIVS